MVEPRLSTIVLSDDEIEACNHAVHGLLKRGAVLQIGAPQPH